jgi:superfamily II DNA or RNA helicase
LLSVHILEIGYDIPHIGIAIIIANSFSSNQIAQTISRVIRKSVGKERALIYVIYIKDTKDDNVLRIVKSAIEKSGEQRSSDNTLQLSLFHEAPNNSA